MRKLVQIITTAIVSVALVGGAASAQSSQPCNGTITVSGNNSNVSIDCSDINTVVISCVNNVNVTTINYQNGVSGPATVTGNASGGNATSGGVFNTNNSNVDATAACAEESTSPTPTPTTTTTPTPSESPTVKPAALPNTSTISAESAIVAGLAIAAIIVAASRLAIAAYRHFTIK